MSIKTDMFPVTLLAAAEQGATVPNFEGPVTMAIMRRTSIPGYFELQIGTARYNVSALMMSGPMFQLCPLEPESPTPNSGRHLRTV